MVRGGKARIASGYGARTETGQVTRMPDNRLTGRKDERLLRDGRATPRVVNGREMKKRNREKREMSTQDGN